MNQALYCANCGCKLETDARFCGECGTPVDARPGQAGGQRPAPKAEGAPPGQGGKPRKARARFGMPLLLVAAGVALALLAVSYSRSPTNMDGPAVTGTPGAAVGTSGEPGKVEVKAGDDPGPVDLAWKTYTNDRYGVSVDFPSALFVEGEAPPDNAGLGFDGKDDARFYVYSHANALEQSAETMLADNVEGIDPATIREKKLNAGGFTLVVARPDEIVRTVMTTSEAGKMIHWLEIGYPPALEAKYAPIAEKMVASLKIEPPDGVKISPAADDPAPSGLETSPVGSASQVVPGAAIAVSHNGWVATQPSADYADLPALMADTDLSADTNLGQLVFVCQPADPSTAYFALVVAPQFTYGAETPMTLAIEGAGAGGSLQMTMRDLYGSQAAEKPNIDWDATILFAPVDMEDLGQIIQADALLVTVDGTTYRIAGGQTLGEAGAAFFAECGN